MRIRPARNNWLPVAALVGAVASSGLASPRTPEGARGATRPLPALLQQARDLARAGDPAAGDRYREAVRRNPSDAPLRAEFADYLWATGNPTEAESQMDWLAAKGHPRAGFLRDYGLRLFDSGNYVKAARILERSALEQTPDPDLLYCLGAARLEKGEFRESEQTLRRAIEKAPGLAAAHHVLGRLLCLTARYKEAVAELRQAARAQAGSADVWLNLSQALQADGQSREAEQACRRSIALQADRAAAHLMLGQILRAEGRKDESDAELAASRSLYDREEQRVEANRASVARLSQGWVLLRMNHPQEALAQLEKVPESSAPGWKARAEALERLGKRDEAIQALERAMTLAPEDHSIGYALERLRSSSPRK